MGLHLTVAAGESRALIGPSGSGKTVLLKVLTGLLSPHSGTVRVLGQNWRNCTAAKRRSTLRQMGMTFQKDGLFDSVSCRENLLLPLYEQGERGKTAEKRVEESLESVGLGGQGEARISEMSGGMQKRLGIARALLFRPKLLVCDEPTSGLDPITSRAITDLLASRQVDGAMTLLVVSSDLREVRRLTQSASFLYAGSIRATGSWQDLENSKDAAVRQFLTGSLRGPLTEMDAPQDISGGAP